MPNHALPFRQAQGPEFAEGKRNDTGLSRLLSARLLATAAELGDARPMTP